jgi:prepilin-type N-terminal cleavage/methylation domain-containing protein
MIGTWAAFRLSGGKAGAHSELTVSGTLPHPFKIRGPASPNGSRGFSLLELIIVLLIISLLSLLVTPRLAKTISHMEVKSAAKKISAILRYCRSDAINKNRIVQVSFDTNSNLITVLSADEGEESPSTRNSYLLPSGIRMEKIEAGKTFFESTLPSFEFYPNGGSNGGDVLLDSQDQKGFKIKVHFLTGSVVIEKV